MLKGRRELEEKLSIKRIVTVTIALMVVVTLLYLMNRERDFPTLSVVSLEVGGSTFSVEIAEAPEVQAKGLSGRVSLPRNKGMLFIFPEEAAQTFWMKGMRFPLDFVWIRAGAVAGVTENAPADDGLIIYSSPEPVNMVFEINASEAARRGIKKGDRVTIK